MKHYNTITLLEALNGVRIVNHTKKKVIITVSTEWKEAVKQYLIISKREFQVDSIQETLLGYELHITIKEFINYSAKKKG